VKPYRLADAEADLAAALEADDWDSAYRTAQLIDTMPGPATPSLHGVARWYAIAGIRVFPLTPGTKLPFKGTRGVLEASADLDRVSTWWTRHPDANIGLATGHGIDVLDFDGPQAHAAWGRAFPGSWEDAGVNLIATVTTPRPGGLHVYVTSDGSGNRAGMLPGVDYRGIGGYVVAPPSILDERPGQVAGVYRFLRAPGLNR
jgi:hypothetical protein